MDLLDQIISQASHPARVRAIRNSISPFRNPDNWQPGRQLLLLHNTTGEQVGFFQEYTFRGARKMVRLANEPERYEVEIVDGLVWEGGPVLHHADPPTEGEIAMIKAKWITRSFRPAWKHKRRPPVDVGKILAEILI